MPNQRKVCQAVGCVTKAQTGYRGYCAACLRKKFPKLYVEKQKKRQKRRIQDKKNRKMKQKKLGIQAGGSGSRVNCKRESQKLLSIQVKFKKEGQRLARYHKVWQGVKNSKKVLYHKTGSFPAYVRHRETETTGSMSSLSDEQIKERLFRWRKCKWKVHTAVAKAAKKETVAEERSAAPAPVPQMNLGSSYPEEVEGWSDAPVVWELRDALNGKYQDENGEWQSVDGDPYKLWRVPGLRPSVKRFVQKLGHIYIPYENDFETGVFDICKALYFRKDEEVQPKTSAKEIIERPGGIEDLRESHHENILRQKKANSEILERETSAEDITEISGAFRYYVKDISELLTVPDLSPAASRLLWKIKWEVNGADWQCFQTQSVQDLSELRHVIPDELETAAFEICKALDLQRVKEGATRFAMEGWDGMLQRVKDISMQKIEPVCARTLHKLYTGLCPVLELSPAAKRLLQKILPDGGKKMLPLTSAEDPNIEHCSRMVFCPVPGCMDGEGSTHGAGYRSLAHMREHLNRHATGSLQGAIPPEFMLKHSLQYCGVCSRTLHKRYRGVCPGKACQQLAATKQLALYR